MKDLKKHYDEHFLSFISITVGSVAIIAAVVWVITAMIRRHHCSGSC